MSQILLTSTMLIFAIVVLRAAFGKWLGLRLRYGLWLLVAIRLLLPFQLGHSTLSVENLLKPAPQTQPTVYVYETPQMPAVEPVPVLQEASSSPDLLHTVWYVGMALSALWFAAVNVRFYRRARKGAKRLSLDGIPLGVYVSEGVNTPCQIGRSIFLTPQVAADEDKRRHVLAHELTHFYHGDTLWSLLRAVLLCVYWFFPPVWLAAALSKKDCELACDEGALLRLGEKERFSYGRTLLSVAAQSAKERQLFGAEASMVQSKRELTARIKAIAGRKKCPLAVILLLAMLVGVTAVCTFTGSAMETPQVTEPSAEQAPTFTEPSVLQTEPQVTQPTLQTAPPELQTAPSEPKTVPTEPQTAESEPQPLKTEPKTEAQMQGSSAGGKFYGTYTVKVGEQLSMSFYLENHVWHTVSDSTVVRTDLFHPKELPPNNYVFIATAYKVGTVEVYFSNLDEHYLAFVIHVVANGDKEEIGYAEQAGETPSFVLPDFNIP